jgi:hypothetical protein
LESKKKMGLTPTPRLIYENQLVWNFFIRLAQTNGGI